MLALVHLQRIVIAERFAAFVAAPPGATTHAVLASAPPVAFAPLRPRERRLGLLNVALCALAHPFVFLQRQRDAKCYALESKPLSAPLSSFGSWVLFFSSRRHRGVVRCLETPY